MESACKPSLVPHAPPAAAPMPKRLRIAFVVYDYNRFIGHSRYTVELATRFRGEHEVHVFANTVDDPDTAGIAFHHVPAVRRNVLTSALSFLVPATLQVRDRFDVVHAQGLAGLRHNVATAHICTAAWFAALDRERIPLTWRQRLFRRMISPLERRALGRSAPHVIAVSGRVKDDLADHYGRTEGVELVHHGTDTATFHPDNRARYRKAARAAVGIHDDRFLALYVGDLQKGCRPAMRAVALTPGVTLLAVSNADPGRYRAEGETLGIADRVIFAPFSRQIERVYAAADAFVFPTLYDSYGLVITEAMATGLAVITNRAAGAAELLQDGTNGLLTAEAWNAGQIAAKLALVRDDASLRERLGRAARACVEPLTWDRTAERTLDVYRRAAAS